MLKKLLDFIVQKSKPLYSLKEKKQLSKVEVDTARQLSLVRNHIERVIGFLRQKYTLLESTLPIN